MSIKKIICMKVLSKLNKFLAEFCKMYYVIVLFFWRRKVLILCTTLFLLVTVWVWAIFYTAYETKDFDNKQPALDIKNLNENHERILAKYGLYLTDTNGVRFVDPTKDRWTNRASSKIKDKLEILKGFIFDKDTETKLRTMEMPTRDEIAIRRESEHLQQAAAAQSHYEHELQHLGVPIIAGIGPGGHQPPNQRLVHLDLKGAPPKITYLKRLLPIMKSLGATGLLIEYEDMFPYESSISNIAAKNAYTRNEIKDLLHSIASVGLTVMPLVQTFGHLEFALKLSDFQGIREVPESPQSICPSQNDSLVFLEEMISQVVNAHLPPKQHASETTDNTDARETLNDEDNLLYPMFTHLHIGCDEVYHMSECPRCKHKTRDELFISHVTAISMMIKKRWPELNVVIWDDMLRHISLTDLQESHLGKLVEPMVWVYAEEVYRFVTSQMWDKYATIFPTAWTASAFKGAFGETLIIPPARRHLENNLKWLTVIQSEDARFADGIQGIALTGWQRYDHFAVLCELLPTAIPALAICLSTVSKGYFNVDAAGNSVLSALTCPESSPESQMRRPWIELNQDPDLAIFSKCMFPGSPVFRYALRLTSITGEAREYLSTLKMKRGWFTPYNIRHNFSSTARVEEVLQDIARLLGSVTSLIKNAEDAMADIFDKWTISEFIELHLTSLLMELREIEKQAKEMKSIKVWPRRPLPYHREAPLDNILKP